MVTVEVQSVIGVLEQHLGTIQIDEWVSWNEIGGLDESRVLFVNECVCTFK